MFNNYTKLTTAFAAFALLFSTGAWSQCADGEIAVDYAITGGSFASEISWTLNDAAGTSVAVGGAPISGQWCLLPGDYTFIGMDSYGDGWNGATATFTMGGNVIGSLAVEGDSGSVVLSVSAEVPGCTDATASNYNAAATVDDGSCCYGDLVTINLYDAFGDGWCYYPTNDPEGGLDIFGQFFPFCSGGQMSLDFCLDPGCYTGQTIGTNYTSEISWDVVVNGVVIAVGGHGEVFFSTDPACIVAGCNVEASCNFNPAANVNDGSCDFLSCAGCTDAGACNYDSAATLEDGTCDYSCIGCMDATATNYDAIYTIACVDCCAYCEGAFAGTLTVDGGSWQSEVGWSLSLGDVEVAMGGAPASLSLCLEAGCYTFSMTDAYGDGWNGNTYSFDGYDGVNVFSGDVNSAATGDGGSEGTDYLDLNGGACTFGCVDAGACNYDATAAFSDGSCDYGCVGCMDAAAANFDPNATIDSGLCVYCDPGTFVLTLNMSDSYGDGWNGAVYYVFDQVSGELMLSGDLDSAFSGDGLSSGADLVCLAPGCYNVEVSGGASPLEVSVSMSDQFGTNYGSTGGGSVWPLDFTLTGACEFSGCTSPSALNYNISASIDDGSCQEPPANDQLANAEALACDAYVNGTLLFSTDDQGLIGSEFAGNEVATSGVWYVINAAADQQVTVSTCDTPSNDAGTDYTQDTRLHVYTQAVDGSLDALASNDDGCGIGWMSSTTFNVNTGLDYYIYVSEYSPFTGGNDFVVTVTCAECADVPSNDDCNDATALVTGETYTGSTCCASQEAQDVPWAGYGTAYGVWFTFNSEDFDTFDFNATNISNDVLGLGFMGSGDCESLIPVAGCTFTGSCAGSVEAFITLEPNTDYYAVIFTTDLNTCGDFEFTTSGVSFGCTDATATNYDATATTDDGTCDFTGVVPANDICDTAEALACNSVTVGSTGGATILGSPIGVAGCETAPGAGVWYSFVGDGQLHNLSTCGSDIDSKINIYTAAEACGGGGIDVPPADACGEGLVTINYSVGGGSWDSEISWSLSDAAGEVASGGAPVTGSVCLPEGDYTLTMADAYGDGWNGGNATFTNGLGEVVGFFTAVAGIPAETATLSVSAYSMEPVYQPGDFTCFDSAISSDGTGTCSLYDADDVNFEFVSTVGTLYYVLVGSEGNAGAFDLVFDCAVVVEGCMNSAACNFDPSANVSTDTCDFWSCVCASDTGTPVQLNMIDAFGDGWNDAGYTISDLAGNLLFEGTLDDAQWFVDDDNYSGPEYGFDMLCLEPGCYNISVTPGDWGSEVSWNITTEDGSVLTAGGAPDSQTISVGGAVCGCTDAGACNYDVLATDEDGSCEYETCAGCMDDASCSYDALATIDDGSCCYSNCVSVQMFDAFGDGWGGYGTDGTVGYVISSVDGVEVASGMLDVGSYGEDTYCLADGCYTITVNEFTYSSEITWTIVGAFGGLVSGISPDEQTFNVGSGDQCVVGCDISCACNYDAAVNISDVAQCVFSGCEGCTYPDASNYDGAAISDDGSCTFDIANPCPADLNNDGSITTGDLLIFLGAFGTIC